MTDMSEMISVRLPEHVVERLRRRAKVERRSLSSLVEEYVDESLRSRDHPGVVFVDGASGRRARLRPGPDVWECISVLKSWRLPAEKAIRKTATWLGIPDRAVRDAIAYYAAFTDEIDGRIAENERLHAEGAAAQEAQEKLLRA
jgi:hypothetical protein